MKSIRYGVVLVATFLIGLVHTGALLGAQEPRYEIEITNLTRGQSFTPILALSHTRADHLLFSPGEPASDELAAMAEGGDIAPLRELLLADPRVNDTAASAGLLGPGDSVIIEINDAMGSDRLSLGAMLIPTNDGFFAFQNLPLPRGGKTVVQYSPAFDAGSEPNDERCINIPGPVCGGEGASFGVEGEGYVHIHGGIHGIADLEPATYDFRNPVARLRVRRVH